MKKILNLCIPLALIATPVHSELKGSATSWETESIVDDFTDETKTFAMIAAEGGFDKGYIHVGCYPKKSFEVKVGAGAYIGDKNIQNNVKYRVDKNEAVTTTMKPTKERKVYFNDMDAQFLKDLIAGQDSVLVQLTSYDYDTSMARFSLKGAKAAIEKVLQACDSK